MTTASLVRFQVAVASAREAVASAKEDRGAAMAEYGLLLALVALAAIGILVAFGGEIVEVFTGAEEAINNRGAVPEAD